MKDKNYKTISKAFERLVTSKESTVKSGMLSMLQDAVKVALELHDDSHRRHLEVGDTYGWILVHDGKMVEMSVTSAGSNEGKTGEMLIDKAARLPQKGWAGVVMAGLTPGYFAIVYEKQILSDTIRVTKDNFSSYFRKI